MAAYGVYGNGNCGGGGGDVYAHGDDTDLYHQVVVLSKPDGSCIRSQANGSGACVSGGGSGGTIIVETSNGRCNGEMAAHQQQPYDSAYVGGGVVGGVGGGVGGGGVIGGGGGVGGGGVGGGGGGGGGQRRHRRSFWCRTTTLATISALLATMFCVTCAVFLYYNCEYKTGQTYFLNLPKSYLAGALFSGTGYLFNENTVSLS